MSYSDPIPCTCIVCGEDATDWRTLHVGDGEAHLDCAYNDELVTTCPHCGTRVLADDNGLWVESNDGYLCPTCGAAQAAEIAAEAALASAVPARGLRPTETTALARILREVSS